MFVTYILFSEKLNRFYVGHTRDIEQRLVRHNNKYSLATKAGVPWKLVYYETFSTKSLASRREREIKARKSAQYIRKLIAAQLV
ncbi:MAG: GIY-YIG nuclease family protein [Bacteroidota bacterium]